MTIENLNVRWAELRDRDWCRSCDQRIEPYMLNQALEARTLAVAESGDERLGLIRVEKLWGRVPFIALVWVAAESRGNGVGRNLVRFIAADLKSKNEPFLLSSSMASEFEAQAWHRRVGFEECGFIGKVNDGDVGEVFFRLDLTNPEDILLVKRDRS